MSSGPPIKPRESKPSTQMNIGIHIITIGIMIVFGSGFLSIIASSIGESELENPTEEDLQKQKELIELSNKLFPFIFVGFGVFLLGVIIIIFPRGESND